MVVACKVPSFLLTILVAISQTKKVSVRPLINKRVGVLLLIHKSCCASIDQRVFVYILRCADGSLYTGITNDLERRVEQHNAGTASRYTRSRLPVTLEYQEEARNKGSALKRELAIKALTRQAKEKLIESVGQR